MPLSDLQCVLMSSNNEMKIKGGGKIHEFTGDNNLFASFLGMLNWSDSDPLP
jgi:hypothetical protein